jgi:hypothetical protein
MKSGIAPLCVASFGGLMQFRPENAPKGSGTRCTVDCEIEKRCLIGPSTDALQVVREVGKDYPADQLRSEFDAVVLCTGATVPRDLPPRAAGIAASTSPWSS